MDKINTALSLKALETLAKELGADVPLSYVRVLFHVAAAGDAGIDQGQLVKILDMSPSSAVRAVQALGKFSWLKDAHGNKKPGLDLLDSVQNPQNFRLRTVTLTANGRRLMGKLGGGK